MQVARTRFFLLLEDETGEVRQRIKQKYEYCPDLMDSWTADVYRLDPSLQKDFTMAKLQAEADQDTDTIGIEANHGNLRKMVFQRVQTCKMSILDLDTLWVARQGNNEDVEERGEDSLDELVGGPRRKRSPCEAFEGFHWGRDAHWDHI